MMKNLGMSSLSQRKPSLDALLDERSRLSLRTDADLESAHPSDGACLRLISFFAGYQVQ